MNAKDVIRQVVESSDMVIRTYVSDLSDRELLVRSVPGANHIAWQLGHIIGGVRHFLLALGQPAPELPAGFAETYSKEGSASDDPQRFVGTKRYLDLLDQMKAASLAAITATPDEALDRPGPEAMREYAPTVGSVLVMLGAHGLMHAGQFVPVRRKLGKPPMF
jgi:hypothetical protein